MPVIPHPQVSSGVAPAVGLAVSAMISIQLAAALSRPEMAEIGAPTLTWICMVAAVAILISLTRPQWRGRTRSAMPAALKLGAALAMMSAAFFAAVNRLPLGPVSTIAFLGPLSVALIGARRARPQALGLALVDGVCVALILAPFASGIQGTWTVDPLGLGFALVTAFGCALFIVLIRCAGSQFSQSDGLCNSLLTATLLLAATGLGGLERILDMSVIWMGAALAILAPLLTCWSEMAVLRKIRPQSFGILMRLEPAIATVLGLVILHGVPSPQQILGMDCVILASAAAVVLLSRKPDLA